MSDSVGPFALGQGEGREIPFFQQRFVVKAGAEDTGGQASIIEIISPVGGTPPMHVHAHEDECFYVLEGEFTFFLGSDRVEAEVGSFVFGPRGVPHGYVVHSSRCRHLGIHFPAGFERFFEEVSEWTAGSVNPATAMGRLSEVALRYGVQLLGPPPS